MVFNKNGQEGGMGLGTLLAIIAGVIVVIVIILGVTGSFGFIFDKISLIPGQNLQAVVSGCELAAANSLRADFCSQLREVRIDGVKQYVTCNYKRIERDMSEQGKLDSKQISCAADNDILCKELYVSDKIKNSDNSVLVNGVSCTPKKCGDYKGTTVSKEGKTKANACSDNTITGKRVISLGLTDSKDYYCCVE